MQRASPTKDYYKILGVSRNASLNEIKSAYRKLVMKYHPDISKTKETEEMFKIINEAYTVLSTPQLKEKYDIKIKEISEKNDNSIIKKVVDTIAKNINIALKEINKVFEEISSDKTLEKLSNEELLQRLYFSDNEFVKYAALKIIKHRRKRSLIPYLVEISKSPSMPQKLKSQIIQTLEELGYKEI